ncbi:MAG: nuclear transport factor 2 family protein [Anaerolineae bacterium]|nr:nuclear transport factor 2 family protein [Anaerolineae bacterium]
MKKWIWIAAITAIAVLVILLTRQGNSEGDVRRLIEDVQTEALDGINRRNPNTLDAYFASVAEGAQETGLAETQEAYKNFIAQMSGESVQIHSFNIEGVEVHEDGGLARVTYRMHLSVIRGGAAVFTVRFTQNLAVLRTLRGWRISGGDTPRIEETTGIWPSR